MKRTEKLFPSIAIGSSLAKTVIVKSKSNIKNTRTISLENSDIENSEEGEFVVVIVKSKSNIKNTRTIGSNDIDVSVKDNDSQSIVIVKSKSNIKNT